ncbi:Glutathione S-transferase 2 [Grifola frondosa]|uniref:glutathione transferase n=1 Tax=Grifola frondosa TaxID=5627 RepID=A0A1C7M2T7_GRIFR|nr:Glutathione S-transferase 2 [Grifola frondosa]
MSHGKQFTLYTHKGGPNGWKVAIVLEELGLSYESIYLDFGKNEQKGEEHTKYNPNGRIPTLIDHKNNDFVIWESNAIITYLVEKYDTEHKISVTGFEDRISQLQWLFFQASGQGPYFGQFAWFIFYHPEKVPSAIERYKNEINRVLGVLDGVLSKQQWLVGNKCTVADLSFITWNQGIFTAQARTNHDFEIEKNFPAVHNALAEGSSRTSVLARPLTVISTTSVSEDDDESNLKKAIKKHALEFFLGHGGKHEEWGESQERSVREEMFRRWKKASGARHVCTTSAPNPRSDGSHPGSIRNSNVEPPRVPLDMVAQPASAGAETFVTAPSHFAQAPAEEGPSVPPPLRDVNNEDESPRVPSETSATALLGRSLPQQDGRKNHTASGLSSSRVPSESIPDITVADNISSAGPILDKTKATKRFVHYEEEAPAPPAEVLARKGSEVGATSAGAAQQATAENQVPWDRMLVRVSYTEDPVPPAFDESQNRITRRLDNEAWAEYIVAWRKDRLELYADHAIPGREWLFGEKSLAFVVPLGSSTTRLSLYSFVDLSFCLTCPPVPLRIRSKGRQLLLGAKRGTNIFVFKMKSRTRAVDWFWQLWRHFGGQIPQYIEIRCPILDTRVKIDIPGYDSADINSAYAVFRKDNVIDLCRKYLCKVQEYHSLIERQLEEGVALELAWRLETNLDWVWQLEDVQEKPREWAVLCGLALKQASVAGKSSHLEIRLKKHFPARLHMKDGTRLDEPPGIEGFLERIRPNSQLKQPVYLTTHDGYLFALPPAHAHHPVPPGLPPGNLENTDGAQTLRQREVRRGAHQILDATGMSDLRTVVAVRRAFQLIPMHTQEPPGRHTPNWEDTEGFWEQVERNESDDEDPGGDVGMAQVQNKMHLRMRRSFELLLTSGRVIRFETYSCQIALEWITRLRPLVSYWKKRHEVDARREMDIAHFSTGRERITPRRYPDDREYRHGGTHEAPPEPPPDPAASLPDLSSFFNWCVLDDCRPILKCGRLYGRKGWWGSYKHIQLVLVSGHLVQYRITGRTSLHHRKSKVISILDAYVCSGYFAAHYLPEGQYNPDAPHVARRYQDGLETDDGEEDTLFVIWYRNIKAERGRKLGSADVPPLSAKRKVAVFRTRSKLERDAWVWAINSEIEKAVRASREWEDMVREAGEILKV